MMQFGMETNTPQPDNLIDWLKAQRQTIANLQRLREFAVHLGLERDEITLIDEMLDRLEQHRFSIAVVGEFKRGKSTLVNALIGEEILPADVLPTTATLNRVTYDLRKYVTLIYKPDANGNRKSEEIDADRLIDYITQLTAESRRNAAMIEQAIVHHNNDYLRKNVDIIDTPGLNDNETMTSVTMGVLPYVDAAIMVLNPENPFGGYEGDFLNKLLLSDLGRVLFVVNAIDRVDFEDRERLIKSIKERIRSAVVRKAEERFGTGSEAEDDRQLHIKRIGSPRVFGLSAQEALDAQQTADEALLEQSLFPDFAKALERFLTNERGVVTLQSLAARVVASGSKIDQRLMVELGSARMSQEQFDKVYQEANEEFTRLEQRLQQELQQIDKATEKTHQKIRPLLKSYVEQLKIAAAGAINTARISPAEIGRDKQPELVKRLNLEVAQAIENAARPIAERVQFILQTEIEIELDRINSFATVVDRSLHDIDLHFNRAATVDVEQVGLKRELIHFTTFSGLFIGGGMLATKGMLGLAALAGMPFVTIPVALMGLAVVGIAAVITSRRAAELLFNSERVENFRVAHCESVLAQIDQQASQEEIEEQFDRHIDDTFTHFRRNIQRDMSGAISQSRQTLEEVRSQRDRNEAHSELQLKELERMVEETARIISKAHGLSSQLRDIKEEL